MTRGVAPTPEAEAERRRKIGEAAKGRKWTPERRQAIVAALTLDDLDCPHGHGPRRRLPSGVIYCRECDRLKRMKQRRAAGAAPHGSKEHLAKLGRPLTPAHLANQSTIHEWLRKHYPKTGICDECGEERKTVFAFKRHPETYTRDRHDYLELCHPCHQRKDKREAKTR